jgi:deazaflavin-dependent oxidoreductase (nitroreductase family)
MWYNPIMIWLLKSPLHFFVSKNMMLMGYTGRKSGKQYTTPVNYFTARDDQGEYLATTSLVERTWWRNLRGGALVTLRLRGRDLQASAEVVENADGVAQGMLEFLSASPGFAKYFQVTIDADGHPNRQQIAQNVQGKVLIKTRLK